MFLGFPCGSAGKESACNAGDLGLIPGLGKYSGEGKGYPLRYSGLENSMDSPWNRKELDMTEQLSLSLFTFIFHGNFVGILSILYVFLFFSWTSNNDFI